MITDLLITEDGRGSYLVEGPSLDGTASVTLSLAGVEDVSDGALSDDTGTARATIRYLLTHQDLVDLPALIEVTDVAAAYPDAIDRIAALRE